MANTGYGNTGKYNAGNWNTGDYNTGNDNTGEYNSGKYNSGNYNSGIDNTGDYNSGCKNTGHYNTGHYNAGRYNTGHYNTGDCNKSDYHTGFFNTKLPEKVYCFNKLVDYNQFYNAELPEWLDKIGPTTWVLSEHMTDQEKQDNPLHEITGGYLRKNDLKQEYRKAFEQATPEDIELTKNLPAFDPDVFLEITGIDMRDEIVINGITYVRKDG